MHFESPNLGKALQEAYNPGEYNVENLKLIWPCHKSAKLIQRGKIFVRPIGKLGCQLCRFQC